MQDQPKQPEPQQAEPESVLCFYIQGTGMHYTMPTKQRLKTLADLAEVLREAAFSLEDGNVAFSQPERLKP
jgi:hypothetical protein